ncbi:HNH endonuclease [Methanomethylophilus alvi]|uniref:HNH endonuclease n=1 Tax=Methanomethylophilus alvi TaxID=1291540 RepID=UPI0037DD30F5
MEPDRCIRERNEIVKMFGECQNIIFAISNGYRQKIILALLTSDHVGQRVEEIPSDGRYDVLYDILSGYSDYGEGKIEDDGWARGFTRLRLVNTRVNQDKFRESILKAYNGSCCITGMDEPSLLRASHIKPWADSSETEKTDVRNGLCLNTLHDAAFDVGLMTVRYQDYTIRLSRRIEDHMSESVMMTISVSTMGWRYPFRTTTGSPVRSISSITWTTSSKNVVRGASSNWSCRIE